MAAAVALGIPVETAAAAVGQVEPVEGRLSVAETPGGVTFIRDDWKAPFWTVAPALEFLRSAHAQRKIAVIGTLSDYPGSSAPRYRNAARMALDAADYVAFVGKMAAVATKRPVEGAEGRILGFDSLHALDRHFRSFLEPGDLVLLKGSNAADHLERLALSRTDEIACWHPRCGLWKPCQECHHQMKRYVPESAKV
jgi:UDP-N-acetylmuramyl pentapeptide synthase